jgi:hypothetical protein
MRADLSCLRRVVLAISSYRNDEEVLALLEAARTLDPGFGAIVVVDSQGTGVVDNAVSERDWPCPVTCVSAASNLGSAGNLVERLRLAGETDLDWVYAINHDGDFQPSSVAALVEVGLRERSSRYPIGAVYPLRRMPNRGGTYDLTGRLPIPFVTLRKKEPPPPTTLDVYWSSSNGALYALDPVRRGLLPWADLWMGYEDLGYGLLLHQHEYRQVVPTDIVIDDHYEFRRPGGIWVTSKPSWYAYYGARNLLLVARRTRQPLYLQAAIAGRLLLELGVTTLIRDHKMERLKLIAQGTIDGVLGRSGKFRVP